MDELRTRAKRCSRAWASCPAGRSCSILAAERDDVELVGGAARDLLLGRTPRELDVVVDQDAPRFAGELAAASARRQASDHEGRFGVRSTSASGPPWCAWQAGRIDVAMPARRALPAAGRAAGGARRARIEEDLRRGTSPSTRSPSRSAAPRKGELRAAPHALEDLARGRLRVLHERSFIDDPTRLLRLARYRARLGFESSRTPPSSRPRRSPAEPSRRSPARASAPSCASR